MQHHDPDRDGEVLTDEVLAALTAVAAEAGATAAVGQRIQHDRGSELVHLGLRTPLRRRRVNEGFSFTNGSPSESEMLSAWDSVWWQTAVADVLFAVLDHYRERRPEDAAAFWATTSRWIDRIDNWAHADDLARVYSRALEVGPGIVYPTLVEWSLNEDQWHRRIAMVSLIRYTGKNANFMPTSQVLNVIANCVADHRANVANAVGWVLRETMKADKSAVTAFLDEHGPAMSTAALRRATGAG